MFTKRHAWLPLVFAVCSAHAEIIEFVPEVAVLDMRSLSTTVTFDVILSGIPPIEGVHGGVSAIDIVVGTDGPLILNSFMYDAVFFTPGVPEGPPVPGPFGVYRSDLYFGGGLSLSRRFGGPTQHLGLLTVGVPGGLATGDYTFQVSSEHDQFSNANGERRLYGRGTVRIVPEPATLVLGMVGAAWLLLQRMGCGWRPSAG